jgi:serine-type D-Ala-D-Ala carboxypeptidase/endopeptidase
MKPHAPRCTRFLRRSLAPLGALLGLFGPGGAAAQTPATQPANKPPETRAGAPAARFIPDAAIRSLMDARVQGSSAKGYSLALIDADGTVRFLSAGSSGNAAREAIDADTIFEIGSITKTFTGTLLAQLQEEGKLKPEATVRDIAARTLPKAKLLPGGAGDIRLEALATHTSGMPRLPGSIRFYTNMLANPGNPYSGYSRDHLWSYLSDYKHDAGKTHPAAYSNLGMGLLGDLLALQEVTDFNSLVQRRIAEPLGLKDTAQDTAPAARNRLAVGHDTKLKPVSYWDLAALAGAGGLRASARDMALYLKAQQAGSLPGSRAAQQPRVKMGEYSQVGYAWITTRRHGDEIVWHNGGTGGFRSFMGFSKVSGRGVVLLTNSAHDQDELAMHLLNAASPLKP